MAIILSNRFSEFIGRRVLNVFTSYDRSKFGIEFEQLSTTSSYRYIFTITGTIDSGHGLTNLLGHKVLSTAGVSLDVSTGQEGFVFNTDKGPCLFIFSPAEEFGDVTLTYATMDLNRAPYATATEYIVQESDFNYGPSEAAVPVPITYYILAAANTPLVTENADNLVWRAA